MLLIDFFLIIKSRSDEADMDKAFDLSVGGFVNKIVL
jgi:hypothetical protein